MNIKQKKTLAGVNLNPLQTYLFFAHRECMVGINITLLVHTTITPFYSAKLNQSFAKKKRASRSSLDDAIGIPV